MKFETKLLFDRLFANFLCIALIPAVFVLGRLLRIDHSINDKNVKNIVVAKYFGLGSITHAMPMLKALKEKYPQANLIFISRKSNQQLFKLISFVDKAYYIDDSSLIKLFISSSKLFLNLWFSNKGRIDLFFDLEVFSSYGVLISLFSLARNRFGYFWAKSTNFKTYIYTHLLYFNYQMPVRLSYMQLARLAGASIEAQIDLLPFNLDAAVIEQAKNKLNALVGTSHKGVLAFNVNASELSYARRWSLENFAQVAMHFINDGYAVVLLGSPEEKDYMEGLLEMVKQNGITQNLYNAAGYFSLPEVIASLPAFDAFLTNDSGLMNLAYAQNAKVIALYGNNVPVFVHIDNGINVAIYKKSYCSPCLYIFQNPPCGDKFVCMQNIKVAEVICAVKKVIQINKSNSIKPANIDYDVINENKDYIFGTLRNK